MLGKIGISALALLALANTAAAQTNPSDPPCTITTTTSTGPNGETITRREGCGQVQITSSGGQTSSATSSTNNRTRTNTATVTPNTTGASDTRVRTPSPAPSPGLGGLPPPSRPNWESDHGAANAGAHNAQMGANFPQPPADFARIVLFDRADFRGRSIGITQDTPNLTSRRFDDLASSARLGGGVWEVCTESNYAGQCTLVTSNTDLDAANIGNTISSVRRVRVSQ